MPYALVDPQSSPLQVDANLDIYADLGVEANHVDDLVNDQLHADPQRPTVELHPYLNG